MRQTTASDKIDKQNGIFCLASGHRETDRQTDRKTTSNDKRAIIFVDGRK